jgi:hypothetical protein
LTKTQITNTAAFVFGAFFVAVNGGRFIHGQNDFIGLYIGGVQVGTPDLYSYAANQKLVTATLGFVIKGIGFVRPPFYAAALKVFGLLSYPVAYWLFVSLILAALIWFVWRFSSACPELPVYAAMCPAVIGAITNGQDTTLFLAVLGASILLFRSGREFAGGLILSLCLVKFHLFLLIPILLLMKARWRILAGGATGAIGLIIFGAIFAGIDSYFQWISMLRNPAVSSTHMMTNLRVLIDAAGGGFKIDLACGLAIVALFVWMCWKSPDFEFLFGLALLGGLLINVHAYVWDNVLLLLSFVLIASWWVRLSLFLLLSPVSLFLLFAFPTTLPYVIAMLGVLAAACVAVWNHAEAQIQRNPRPSEDSQQDVSSHRQI